MQLAVKSGSKDMVDFVAFSVDWPVGGWTVDVEDMVECGVLRTEKEEVVVFQVLSTAGGDNRMRRVKRERGARLKSSIRGMLRCLRKTSRDDV
jgi:hypothetical protein